MVYGESEALLDGSFTELISLLSQVLSDITDIRHISSNDSRIEQNEAE